jgi:agmatinase
MYPTHLDCRFGGYDDEHGGIVLFGIPYYPTTMGAKPVLSSTDILRLFSKQAEEKSASFDIYYSEISCIDIGDIITTRFEDIEIDINTIVDKANNQKKKILMIGGEHTYTYFTVKKIRPSTLVVLDAHLDLKDTYMGSKLTHATFLRRVLEKNCVDKVIIIGARGYDESEWTYIAEDGRIDIIDKNGVFDNIESPIYISIDLDVYDTSIMKTVSSPEPDGLMAKDVFNILRILNKKGSVVGGDVMEFTPFTIDPTSYSLAVKTVFELLATLYY